jgi:hypothetical protein
MSTLGPLARKHLIFRPLAIMSQRHDRGNRRLVQVDGALMSVLCFRQLNGSSIQMYLGPFNRVMLPPQF